MSKFFFKIVKRNETKDELVILDNDLKSCGYIYRKDMTHPTHPTAMVLQNKSKYLLITLHTQLQKHFL